MQFKEFAGQTLSEFWFAFVAALGAGLLWLFRTIFTNKQQIELLQQRIDMENQIRIQQIENDRDRMDRMSEAIHELNSTQKDVAPAVKEQNELLRRMLNEQTKEL